MPSDPGKTKRHLHGLRKSAVEKKTDEGNNLDEEYEDYLRYVLN